MGGVHLIEGEGEDGKVEASQSNNREDAQEDEGGCAAAVHCFHDRSKRNFYHFIISTLRS
jgi:hypothetical protein